MKAREPLHNATSYSGVAEDFGAVGRYAVTTVTYLPMFRTIVLLLSPGSLSPRRVTVTEYRAFIYGRHIVSTSKDSSPFTTPPSLLI